MLLPELGASRCQSKQGGSIMQGERNEEQGAGGMSISKNDTAQTNRDGPDPEGEC